MRTLNGFALAASLALTQALPAHADCHFPPTRPQPRLAAYETGEKMFAEQTKLTNCLRSSDAAIAYATEDGVFCISGASAGTTSVDTLHAKIRKAYDNVRPFAVYYNGNSPKGDGNGGLMFSAKEECAKNEVANLLVSARDGSTCRDFQNSSEGYSNGTPGSKLARYLHVGAKAVAACKKASSDAAAKNNSSPNGSVKSSGNSQASKKTKTSGGDSSAEEKKSQPKARQ